QWADAPGSTDRRDAMPSLAFARLRVRSEMAASFAVSGDSHKNGETRRALQPLVDLASEACACLLGITHFSKGTSGRDPLERITGSVAFGALPRVVLVAAREADTLEGALPRRILARAKANNGPDDGGFYYS